MKGTCDRLSSILLAMHHGRKYMVEHVWKTDPELFKGMMINSIKLNLQHDACILLLFNGSGCDPERTKIFSFLAQHSEYLKVMKDVKIQILSSICWQRHEELFTTVIEKLSITGKDLRRGNGEQSNFCGNINMCIMVYCTENTFFDRLPLCVVDSLQRWQ
jgi:hypothetical protein